MISLFRLNNRHARHNVCRIEVEEATLVEGTVNVVNVGVSIVVVIIVNDGDVVVVVVVDDGRSYCVKTTVEVT